MSSKKTEAKTSKATKTPKAKKATTGTETPVEQATAQHAEASTDAKTAKQAKKAKAAKPKKVSALDAAAKVLAEVGEPMNCASMIEAMAAKGYWKSPGGQTPAATLYSAILREVSTKGKDARFKKTERGKFAIAG
jgi:prophage DNA circulation protein